MRTNEGYTIIKEEVYEVYANRTYGIVLAYNPKADNWVTWECINHEDYFWGHYFISKESAFHDYYIRLANKHSPEQTPF